MPTSAINIERNFRVISKNGIKTCSLPEQLFKIKMKPIHMIDYYIDAGIFERGVVLMDV